MSPASRGRYWHLASFDVTSRWFLMEIGEHTHGSHMTADQQALVLQSMLRFSACLGTAAWRPPA